MSLYEFLFPEAAEREALRATGQEILPLLETQRAPFLEGLERPGLLPEGPQQTLIKALLSSGASPAVKTGLEALGGQVSQQAGASRLADVFKKNQSIGDILKGLIATNEASVIPSAISALQRSESGQEKLPSLARNVMLATGQGPESPVFRATLEKALFTPKTRVAISNLPKPPSGFWWKDPNDPLQGLTPMKGGPVERLTPEQAAKKTLIENAQVMMPVYKEMLFDGENINRDFIFNMNMPLGGTPGTQGRSGNAIFKDIAEGKIRAESGAAVPHSEVARLAERFRPSILDRDETIKLKTQMLENFLNGTLANIDPESPLGKFLGPKDTNLLRQLAKGKSAIPPTPPGTTLIEVPD